MSFQNIQTKSQELKQIFEYELRRKLSEKTKNPINSLLTSFHYFDTNNSGAATPKMWFQTFTKIGLSGFSQTDMQIIFDCYDLTHSGLIDYKNFCYYLYDQCNLQPIPKEVANEINNIILIQEQENLKKLNQFHSELPQMIGSNVYKQNLNERFNMKIKSFNQKNSSNIANILNPKLNSYNKNFYEEQKKYFNDKNHDEIHNIIYNNNNNYNNNNDNINNNIYQKYFQNNNNNINNNNISNNINNNNNNNNNINNNNINNNIYNNNNNNLQIQNQTKYIQTLIELFRNKININSGITFYKFANNLFENTFNNDYYSTNINNKLINFETFCKSLNDSNIHIENFYCQDIFNYLLNKNNNNNNNSIFIEDILNILKGDSNTLRKNIIINKFYEIDNNKRGIIETGTLLKIFNAKNHPEVLLGRKTENEIFNEFIYTFDIFKKLYNLSSVITVNDFVEYYSAISASIDNDDYFNEMINAVWTINNNNNNNNNILSKSFNKISQVNQILNNNNDNNNENNFISTYNSNYNNNNIDFNKINNNNNYNYYKRNFSHSAKRRYNSQSQFQYNPITNEYSISDFNYNNNNREYSKTPFRLNNNYFKNIQSSISNFTNALNTLRNILISRGPKSIFILERLFILTHSNKINFETFNNLTQTYKLNISFTEKKTIFDNFDKSSNGFIFYDDLIKSLCGKINDFRLNIVINVFNSFNNKNNNNKISLNNMLNFYNKNNHPDVLSGKKLAEEVFGDFIDMINIFKEYKEFLNNENYDFWSVQDFVDFYSQISLGITDDEYFENLMKNVWNLDDSYYNDNYNNYYNNDVNNQRIKTGTVIMNGRY